MNSVLISATELADALEEPRPPRVLDCRARLGQPAEGRLLWWEAHLPSSRHLDLETDLAGSPGVHGRHPLPREAAFVGSLQRLGITAEEPVVVYDDMGGQLAAARAWWMLACWAGHPDVRLLDGGIKAWVGQGGDLVGGDVSPPRPSRWQPQFRTDTQVTAEEVFSGRALKVDARGVQRFRGEVEPIDPVAGHIPGAVCRPSSDNLTPAGRFKPAAELARELPHAEEVVAYCGSGVTACHNVLAYAVAGRALPKLYPGSWSEWIRDPSRPVATGG
ncbi:sulfurtransferase [Halomonas urumqiensis]|uniref:Sulfurtransferase n=1 Tax=Halomonas urumqiensis TaxID=1684789 RepID=A0A2N7UGJ5_9GAMM|nr:sulfurtransferase [Halomonas urumqiensis]PMR79542.1 sulfurtransferase [Halomonas urumqiensis]PTB01337.1 sulfurtransferase [Halomonas urumqiensis]GHE22588.1 sulfurtransferase [Halomonas urumqiensis]